MSFLISHIVHPLYLLSLQLSIYNNNRQNEPLQKILSTSRKKVFFYISILAIHTRILNVEKKLLYNMICVVRVKLHIISIVRPKNCLTLSDNIYVQCLSICMYVQIQMCYMCILYKLMWIYVVSFCVYMLVAKALWKQFS